MRRLGKYIVTGLIILGFLLPLLVNNKNLKADEKREEIKLEKAKEVNEENLKMSKEEIKKTTNDIIELILTVYDYQRDIPKTIENAQLLDDLIGKSPSNYSTLKMEYAASYNFANKIYFDLDRAKTLYKNIYGEDNYLDSVYADLDILPKEIFESLEKTFCEYDEKNTINIVKKVFKDMNMYVDENNWKKHKAVKIVLTAMDSPYIDEIIEVAEIAGKES